MVTTVQGAMLYVSASLPATNDLAGFNAVPFTQVRGVRAVNGFSLERSTRSSNLIDEDLTTQSITSQRYSNPRFEMVYIQDAGQAILKQAMASNNRYAFKVLFKNGTGLCFTGLALNRAMSFDGVQGVGVDLSISTHIIEF